MTKPLGPNFGGELIAAGLGGLLIAWAPDGGISGRQDLTLEQNAMLDAAIAAHDPDARPPCRNASSSTACRRRASSPPRAPPSMRKTSTPRSAGTRATPSWRTIRP